MKNLDLNLLPQLQVLLELKNVSRAAERLQLSQPATSASTARLFNISSVVLGGHFAILAEWMMPALSKSLATFAPGIVPPDSISLSALGQAGALVGAAGSVIRALLDAPHRVAGI